MSFARPGFLPALNFCCLRHPVIPCVRKSAAIRTSVALFPWLRIAAITSLRFFAVKMSAIASAPDHTVGSGFHRKIALPAASEYCACEKPHAS